jgi:hypothetical protein
MVVLGNYLYVGGTSLHRYANNVWDAGNVPQPPGRIIDLAATTAYLYALVNTDSSGLSPELYRWPGSGQWGKVTFSNADYPRLQAIYGETDSEGIPISAYLFAGASKTNISNPDTKDYAVFYTSGSNTLNFVRGETGLLTGAATDSSNNHYFSTKAGVYHFSSSTPSTVTAISNVDVTGLIQTPTPGPILALCYNGDILNASSGAKLYENVAGFNLRGPATIWRNSATSPSVILLLMAAETKDSLNRTYGYREINITSGLPASITPKEPGTPPSSMDDSNRYKDTIESKPLNGIFQVPSNVDPAMPLFASVQGTGTAKDNTDGGLWSYRVRDNIWQWNAEE